MAKIGIGAPKKIWKGNLMECTWTINQTNMMNGLKKNRGWEKPKKMVGPREQRMVEIQLEIVEVEKTHSVLTNAVIIVN